MSCASANCRTDCLPQDVSCTRNCLASALVCANEAACCKEVCCLLARSVIGVTDSDVLGVSKSSCITVLILSVCFAFLTGVRARRAKPCAACAKPKCAGKVWGYGNSCPSDVWSDLQSDHGKGLIRKIGTLHVRFRKHVRFRLTTCNCCSATT